MLNENSVNKETLMDEGGFFASGMDLEGEKIDGFDDEVEALEQPDVGCHVAGKLMHSGIMGKKLASALKKSVAKENLTKDVKNFVKTNDGVLGTVLIDCDMFKNAKEWSRVSKTSPYKKCVQYAVNCTCSEKQNGVVEVSEDVLSANENAIDAFLNPVQQKKASPVKMCKKFGVPVLSDLNKYSSDDAVQILKKMITKGDISEKEAKKMIQEEDKPLRVVSAAFHLVEKKKAEANLSKNSPIPDASQYKIEESDLQVDVAKPVEGVEMDNPTPGKIEIKNIAKAKKDVDVKVAVKSNMDIKVAANPKSLNVKNEQFIDSEWFDQESMVVSVDKKKKDELDVDPNGDFVI